jgi:hypothetical protein
MFGLSSAPKHCLDRLRVHRNVQGLGWGQLWLSQVPLHGRGGWGGTDGGVFGLNVWGLRGWVQDGKSSGWQTAWCILWHQAEEWWLQG